MGCQTHQVIPASGEMRGAPPRCVRYRGPGADSLELGIEPFDDFRECGADERAAWEGTGGGEFF